VRPQGGGTKLDWGNPGPAPDVILSTARLNRILEHVWADMTVTVEAGCTVRALQSQLAQHKQWLAIDPLWPERATIGGILATNDSGALRVCYGALRDLIIGITVALPDGTLALSGGKVVKNVAGYDLPKLMTGALGTLGVITQAVFRLHPLPHHSRTLTSLVETADEAQKLMLSIQYSQLAHIALQARTVEQGIAVDVMLAGTEAGIDSQQRQLSSLTRMSESDGGVWGTRERLWPSHEALIVKFSVLPSKIATTLKLLDASAVVVQATGIGHAKLGLDCDVAKLRREIQAAGGSLVLLTPSALDAWGSTGDALLLMGAVKQQFDPNAILNRGRFVGGI
jgi:glycolate oxidase FAD binding subunit